MGRGTEIGRVRGLGAAKSGVHHWWLQRVTAIANLLLVVWFIVSLVRLPDLGYQTVTDWMAQPLVAVPLILFVVSVFWHLRLGLQVLIEDYLHEGTKVAMLLALNAFAVAGGLVGVFSILKIALGA
ncbi:succinate dehydrogenase, hydrophobic membrane anchor protein [Sphingosinicella microcystinivorans]|uniref:Succinate dehydrogenase hydrophobic membrane anchor subunit n=1 Tax=Sphingosinicella microcystinivorans TaxID=335406 RepID=A0AAD1G2K0_SPHMI|nr:succinate dehydrogenase, hydrophobic membrane anchor protein [Sphingosinicella microcystinivorans]RKS87945.1 succinate dehydrogenase subunit D [Sphingosinicella microcystinivorans]BBE35756.1 succinate dehydrogenase, hydrophobic membrane anchor protein [Sphingosinicella microcystinivorans]